MDKLRPFGLRFALDDFGSRYANLSIFTNIPFDSVKLDRSLIRELSYNTVGRTLVGDIVRICTKQGMLCVARKAWKRRLRLTFFSGKAAHTRRDSFTTVRCQYGILNRSIYARRM